MSRATFTYGRFNPPTEAGHGKLVKQVMDHAESTGGKHYIFASHSQDGEKNPLSHQYKTRAMRKMFPGANVVTKKHPNLIGVMQHLEKQGHTHVTMYAGSDRVPEYKRIVNKYNGKDFKFKKIEVKSAGSRDPDAEGSEGMSASKLRGLVSAGKRREFISHYTNRKLGAELHDKVKKAMSESRALFLLGGPGSGKDYVINNILSRFNVVEVQMDQILNGSINELLESGSNLLINAPIDLDKIALVRATLGESYEFDYALVSVTNKVSRERNDMRSRPMNESVRIRKWLDAERTTDMFEGVFKFENSLNLSEASQKELSVFQMQIEAFLKFMIENGYVFEKKVAEPTGDLKNACWKGYTAVGMKMKNGRKVPNCVPVKESDNLKGTPVVSLADVSKPSDFRKDRYGRSVPKKLKKNDPKVKYVKEGFDPEPSEIAAYLKKKHGKVKPEHLDAYERSRDTSKPLDREEIMKHVKEAVGKESKIIPIKGMGGVPGFKVTNRRLKQTRSFNNEKDAQAYAARGGKQQKEALEYGTTETRNAYASMTPGQTVDTTPTLKTKKLPKSKKTPGEDYDARMGGSGGYAVGLTQTESVSLEEAVKYHLENQIPFAENIFRPGSDMFFELIREAKNLYANGDYTPADEYEQEVLESDLGETAMYEGMEVLLDFPFIEEEAKHVRKLSKVEADEEEAVKVSIKKEETCCDDCDEMNEEDETGGKGIGKPWREGGGGAVYVRTGDGGVKKVRFSQSGMAKKYRDPGRLKSFMARHNCLGNKDKTSASYWACRYPRFFSNSGQLWW